MNIRRFASPIGSFSLFNRLICFTMAIIKNGLSMMMRGKVGAFSYYVSETRQIVRQAQNNSNFGATATRAPGQQSRRVKWANLVNFYSGNKGWMKKAFEGLKPGVSVFNRFMQINLPEAYVALTKAQAAAKTCIICPFNITQGSLPTISSQHNGEGRSAVKYDEEFTAGTTTVGAFSRAIIAANSSFLNGDAIVCVVFGGTWAEASDSDIALRPATYDYKEFVLDVNSEAKMSEKYPSWTVLSGNVACTTAEAVEAFAFIHSRSASGQLLVSSEKIRIQESAEEKTLTWGSAYQVADASESYKVETPVMLAPGGSTTGSSATGNTPGSGGGGGGDDDDTNLGE